jgi:hypothetical protein
VAILIASLASGTVEAAGAELGNKFKDYTEMHKQTRYGSLLFRGAATEGPFTLVDGDGELTLPPQDHYCFVLNHYSLEKGYESRVRTYRAKTTKWYSEETTTTELFRKEYIPTADETSENVTDYCIYGISGVIKVAIEFDSNDGSSFRRKISFKLK